MMTTGTTAMRLKWVLMSSPQWAPGCRQRCGEALAWAWACVRVCWRARARVCVCVGGGAHAGGYGAIRFPQYVCVFVCALAI